MNIIRGKLDDYGKINDQEMYLDHRFKGIKGPAIYAVDFHKVSNKKRTLRMDIWTQGVTYGNFPQIKFTSEREAEILRTLETVGANVVYLFESNAKRRHYVYVGGVQEWEDANEMMRKFDVMFGRGTEDFIV